MKKLPSVRVILMTIIVSLLTNIIFNYNYSNNKNNIETNNNRQLAYVDMKYELNTISNIEISSNVIELHSENVVSDVLIKKVDNSDIYPEYTPIVYDGMTLYELGEKLDRSLKSSLSGYGQTIALYALKYDVDPYMAVAIMLHETGCASGKCSTLTSSCNNVGGMKGGPTCGNGSYRRFNSLEDGIESFMKNLSNNYIKKGLTTPETINTKYAASTTWANQVKNYINKIKNS